MHAPEPAIDAAAADSCGREIATCSPGQQPAAIPVVFSRTVGLFMPAEAGRAPSGSAVLFASPWGLEEMCTRKFWRIVADELSKNGIPSLRFDYSGTGDALEPALEDGIGIWRDDLVAAADLLRMAGYERLLLVGQGLGGALALDVSPRLSNLDGIALLAPVLSGRAYLRELAVWAKVVDESLQLGEDLREKKRVSIAGLTMPERIAEDVRRLDLARMSSRPVANCLMLARAGRSADTDFASHLRGLGTQVEERVFTGYEELIANPTASKIPFGAVADIVAWSNGLKAPSLPEARTVAIRDLTSRSLSEGGFTETPIRFGDADRLYGILCEPAESRVGASVVMLGSAYDRHSGWSRLTVESARRLAGSGIASLRFDAAGVADSPPRLGAPAQVLYSEAQQADVTAALDYLESRHLLPAIAVGRCSGAYLAFQSSLKDRRVRGLVAANPYTFYWDPARPLQLDLRSTPQSLATYRRKLLRIRTLKGLFNGAIDVRQAARNVVNTLLKRSQYLLGSVLGILAWEAQEQNFVRNAFRSLSDNGTELSLIYSANDVGLDNFKLYFGPGGDRLKRFANVHVTMLDNADHNLTPDFARALFQEHIAAMALKFDGQQRGDGRARGNPPPVDT